MARVTRLDCVRNEEIRKGLKQEAVVAQVKRRREGWKDRVLENQGSIEKVMRGQVEGRKPRRPRRRWSDDFQSLIIEPCHKTYLL